MGRPSTREKRRQDLIQAALDAAAGHGLRQLSMSDVANQAGLTRSALLYYYEDLDELLVDAHAAGNARLGDARDALVAAQETPGRMLAAAIDAGLPEGPDDTLMRSLYEFDVLAGKSPVHDRLVKAMYERQLAVYRSVLEFGSDQGDFELRGDVPDIAMNFVALEDAYGLHIVGGNSLVSVADARRAIRLYAQQAGCPVPPPGD
ncbi:TetR/AcrR family transcriptional regulator [Cryobacterium tepidiphilum]|uniref:TetR family transcriptional regulator n=1 Tax=Cryobacterium tepidiphilum TaxID=2486026 RepID=A0A3M8LPY7_9MICO|nr:TetR family transcriptional regulator [Cryobacterium tepidiphilum]RNE67441.1 TetR family transcriptional regulator [Cryobacterium tepidiphilum]